MALYLYKCPKCGWTDEVMRPFVAADDPFGCSLCGELSDRVLYPGCNFDIPGFKNGTSISGD